MNPEPLSMFEPTARLGRIAILWRGDEVARRSVSPETSRFKAVFAALADVGVDAEPVVYEDDVLDAVRAQLASFDGVLVWVNPIHEEESRPVSPRDATCHHTPRSHPKSYLVSSARPACLRLLTFASMRIFPLTRV
jgi:hypothetical protein